MKKIIQLTIVNLFICSLLYSQPIETRIKIAVIDTGIRNLSEIMPFLCKMGHQNFVDPTKAPFDEHGHGTVVSWLIIRNLDPNKYCIVIYKYTSGLRRNSNSLQNSIIAIRAAVNFGVRYINYSSTGYGYNAEEVAMYKIVLAHNIRVIVAAGNNGINLNSKCVIFPACAPLKHPNFYVIGNCNNGHYHPTSNYGGPVKICRNGEQQGPSNLQMSGTSMSTAIFTNELILREALADK